MVKYWLKLIRPGNVLFIGMIPIVFHYGFIVPLNIQGVLGHLETIWLALSLILIAAAGYVVNDIHDQGADAVNRPDRRIVGRFIPETTAFTGFGILALAGVALGFSLAWRLDNTSFAYLHAIALALLWLYAADFRGRILIGNFLISLLAALNVFAVALFDLFPAADETNFEAMSIAFYVILAFCAFAFWTTLIREIIKDAEDAKGDAKAGYKTIGTQWNLRIVKSLVFVLSFIELTALLGFAWLARGDMYSSLWVILVLVPTLVVPAFLLFGKARTPKQMHYASTGMKIHMFAGMISPVIFSAIVYVT